jgi:DNA polymerase I-like protein with 3'-5' exonuclease and polymerase domains
MFKLDCTLKEVKENHKALRIAAKSIVFGLLYGRGASAIAREVAKAGVDCTREEAQEFMAQFMTQFPRVQKLIDDTHKMVEERGYVIGAWGRREYFYNVGIDDDGVLARQKRMAFNFLIALGSINRVNSKEAIVELTSF